MTENQLELLISAKEENSFWGRRSRQVLANWRRKNKDITDDEWTETNTKFQSTRQGIKKEEVRRSQLQQ